MRLTACAASLLMLVTACGQPSHLGGFPAATRQQVKRPAAAQPQEKPIIKRLASGRYKVRKPWTVHAGNRLWQVPAGYVCNGITAPERVKKSLGDGVEHAETWAAIFHDWLFTQPGVTRAQADGLFHELMLAYGISPAKAGVMHAMVSAYSVSKNFR